MTDDVPTIRPSSENNVTSKSIPTDKPFNPDAFALALSKDMSRWNETLQQTYPDVFHLDTSFEQSLPEEARQYFHERQQRLNMSMSTGCTMSYKRHPTRTEQKHAAL